MMDNQNCCCNYAESNNSLIMAKEELRAFKEMEGGLIPALHKVQDIYGYLPEEALKLISEELDVPITDIYGVASFYSLFSLVPKGKHVVSVCLGTACYVNGAQKILDRLSEELEVKVGKTTRDGKFTLQSTRCIGACGLAPVIMIDEKVYGRVIPNDIPKILKDFE
ncbi:NADH-quinone oxidoreductase subunit NuoE [Alkaliphilus sp. B6464]|uniref:NADH-quinone oxidoreductase subunit NuoE n=1 Tax=Alkaliphilus sp. B6464 TaxID=2731219 RepID=UPI00201182F5|nr:NADH-quinone oxidoreductase subunit NuoE [Alkaliphilus sp. B6464]